MTKMMIPEDFQDLLIGRNFANVATINPDGSPQVTPMWVDFDKTKNEILVNTAKGRKKARNMFVGAKVALSIQDQQNYYRYLAIQGEVLSVTEDGAADHIDKLAMRYMGKEKYPLHSGQTRLLIRIKPNFVHTLGRNW